MPTHSQIDDILVNTRKLRVKTGLTEILNSISTVHALTHSICLISKKQANDTSE